MIAEQGELLIANLDGGTTVLQAQPVSFYPSIRFPTTSTRETRQHTCGIKTRSPALTLGSILFPSWFKAPGPTANTRPSDNFSMVLSGKKIPEAVLVSALMRWMRTRSRRGARALMDLREVAYDSIGS